MEGSAGTTTTADIADSTIAANHDGVLAFSSSASGVVRVSVRDSQVVRNLEVGVYARSNGGASVTLSASNNILSNNLDGIVALGAGAKVWASGNTVSDNNVGLFNGPPAGLLESAGDNAVRNNTLDTYGVISPAPEM